MKWGWVLLIVGGGTAGGCGGDPAGIAPVRLRHDPPVSQLSAEQLRALSIDCEKYSPHDTMRGRYDARYCEDAVAAWGDSPLQMVTIPASRPASPSASASPSQH